MNLRVSKSAISLRLTGLSTKKESMNFFLVASPLWMAFIFWGASSLYWRWSVPTKSGPVCHSKDFAGAMGTSGVSYLIKSKYNVRYCYYRIPNGFSSLRMSGMSALTKSLETGAKEVSVTLALRARSLTLSNATLLASAYTQSSKNNIYNICIYICLTDCYT